MSRFPTIHLPDYFTSILSANMQVSGQGFSNLHSYVVGNKPLLGIVNKVFRDIGENIEIGRIIKSLGWVGFRNRLANSFLEYEIKGYFPDKLDSSFLIDVINLEEDLKPYEVSGYSRAFLLGFYMKMADIKSQKRKEEGFTLDLTCIPYLDFANSKFPKIDWSYLMLVHFNEFLGEQSLKEELTKKSGFDKIYKMLTDEHKDQLSRNLLAYGCSVGEADMFYETRV